MIFNPFKFIQSILGEKEKITSETFHPLSPTTDAEDCDTYINSLNWALKNNKTIKNIAVSGSYGSGKSSIIQTFIKRNLKSRNFIKRYLFPDYKFLNISLATFKDNQENNKNVEKIQPDGNELLRLIELSLLQQLFFHEKDSKIPDSRFRKIKSLSNFKLFFYSIGITLLLFSLLYILSPSYFIKFIPYIIPRKYEKITHYSATTASILGIFYIIYNSSRSLINLSIKKLNISNAEIEIEGGISKSILNNHLDEIIYFFEVTKYNVIIIEDLDRFEQTDIFIKLREINLLINQSKKIKRAVTFIYAIKDDMFLDKDRAKFFDFIVPIIPVINMSNSVEKLRHIIKINNYKIDEELSDNLSLFIDDMRLLYNIMNEYHVYSEKVDKNLDQNKLLSIIVYKNIFPKDFNLLSQNDGDLYETISKKSEYIKASFSKIDEQISSLKKRIRDIEENQKIDLKELKIIYLSKIIVDITSTQSYPFYNFIKNGTHYSIHAFAESDQFDFYENTIAYSYDRHGNQRAFHYDANSIEKTINPTLTYKEREDLIKSKDQIDDLKIKIESLNEQKNNIQKSNLKTLLFNKEISFTIESQKKSNLINILLRNGYIDENYMDYISIFHEGTLTKTDYQFLLNIRINTTTRFDYKLHKTQELIKKINEFEFEKEFVLNFNLVAALIENPIHTVKKHRLFDQLRNQKDISIDFIDKYIETSSKTDLFILELCKHWKNIWNYIQSSNSYYSQEKTKKYFTLIIQFAETKDIIEIFSKNKDYINHYSDFLNLPVNGEKLIAIIESLNIKFNSINPSSPEHLVDNIYKGSYYSISTDMIRFVVEYKKLYNTAFTEKNYSFIHSSGLQVLIEYIEQNIEEYIKEVYLNIPDITEEDYHFYIKLLNNEKLRLELKEKVIIKNNNIIEDISSITDSKVWELLFQHKKIKPDWENILNSFDANDKSLSEPTISFMNDLTIAETLSKKTKNQENYEELFDYILFEANIDLKSYEFVTKSIPWNFDFDNPDQLSKNKALILIENGIIKPSIESFHNLKLNYERLNILLLEKNVNIYTDLIESGELILDDSDIEQILNSDKIQDEEKFIFIDGTDSLTTTDNSIVLKMVLRLFVEKISVYDFNIALRVSLLLNKSLPTNERIMLFNNTVEITEKEIINNFLVSLGNEYVEITERDKKATLSASDLHRQFLDNLVKRNYISSFSIKEKGLRVNHLRNE